MKLQVVATAIDGTQYRAMKPVQVALAGPELTMAASGLYIQSATVTVPGECCRVTVSCLGFPHRVWLLAFWLDEDILVANVVSL